MSRGPQKQFDTEAALTKAMEVFWTHGYEAASMTELLKNMGIGKKSLYRIMLSKSVCGEIR
ncbi:MAG: TetR/AcrR family transcriptional regulator [Lyngbya sp.]|nr:TetR/AcrR family transcriptional regulator [Lyngbya sp.]